ncbi:GmrSD restriction endonuclease domain-containing protein [Acetobacter thailandicus]|uniref:DUF262 domain-containing protein n=1 Tax=Acetobacter thailandicus TaxID=1502842 RepID=A0ABT3QCI3_9PROT|nr:DUF262 domain-containing protein [Acetobacter thailandicus]MCX2562997.1 DUF262 domain-containing protein [Acetobacter thailandicus]NHN96230.1 DUF262 domain-containing protein [Acetobacter thailandicus]
MSAFFEDDEINSEDINESKTEETDLRNAVLYNTDWTVETIVNQIKKNRIDLSPAFQRRDAWTLRHKSLFIESILLNFPIPSITLAEDSDTKRLILVDGKQRLTTLSQFMGSSLGSKNNNFKLTGLSQLSHLNGKNYTDLASDFVVESITFDNFSIRTNIIRGWKNNEILYSIFHRLNSGSVKLSPQELRQSLFPGDFATFILVYSEESSALKDIFPGIEPDFRMRDVELITRYLSLVLFIEDYSGDLKKSLDATVENLNTTWPASEADIRLKLQIFENAYQALKAAFEKKHLFKKWTNSGWEKRTNRAIFDAMMFNFQDKSEISKIIGKKEDIQEAFKEVSQNKKFVESIERTTKTTNSLYNRISIFGDALRKRGFSPPKLELLENKIKVL